MSFIAPYAAFTRPRGCQSHIQLRCMDHCLSKVRDYRSNKRPGMSMNPYAVLGIGEAETTPL